MSCLLFIDESGHDRRHAPYEVLAGLAIEDRFLWDLILELQATEIKLFGTRYSKGSAELKGSKLLTTKVFRHAQLSGNVGPAERAELARFALENGAAATALHLKALAFAKLDYIRAALTICAKFGCAAFASIVDVDAPATSGDGLRKDYAYLFERFFYFLEARNDRSMGIIVFDELEKSRSHVLVDQSHRYFRDLKTGQARAKRILPEPFFVHSDLTTGIQLADIVAYTISWGVRFKSLVKPARPELAEFASLVLKLRQRAVVRRNNDDFEVMSFAHITDLRTQNEK
jgi:hypothetical protein